MRDFRLLPQSRVDLAPLEYYAVYSGSTLPMYQDKGQENLDF